tara:strand:+ start:132 stop:434 length:303 start_codon:yes stop_codon:yes gene_type:complete
MRKRNPRYVPNPYVFKPSGIMKNYPEQRPFDIFQFMEDQIEKSNRESKNSILLQDTFRHYLKKKKMKKMSELKVVLLGDPKAKQIIHSSRLIFQKVYTYL